MHATAACGLLHTLSDLDPIAKSAETLSGVLCQTDKIGENLSGMTGVESRPSWTMESKADYISDTQTALHQLRRLLSNKVELDADVVLRNTIGTLSCIED